jgi:hypothetical protein
MNKLIHFAGRFAGVNDAALPLSHRANSIIFRIFLKNNGAVLQRDSVSAFHSLDVE